jgi:hypothetical protein
MVRASAAVAAASCSPPTAAASCLPPAAVPDAEEPMSLCQHERVEALDVQPLRQPAAVAAAAEPARARAPGCAVLLSCRAADWQTCRCCAARGRRPRGPAAWPFRRMAHTPLVRGLQYSVGAGHRSEPGEETLLELP